MHCLARVDDIETVIVVRQTFRDALGRSNQIRPGQGLAQPLRRAEADIAAWVRVQRVDLAAQRCEGKRGDAVGAALMEDARGGLRSGFQTQENADLGKLRAVAETHGRRMVILVEITVSDQFGTFGFGTQPANGLFVIHINRSSAPGGLIEPGGSSRGIFQPLFLPREPHQHNSILSGCIGGHVTAEFLDLEGCDIV